jgi:hypothetical protein
VGNHVGLPDPLGVDPLEEPDPRRLRVQDEPEPPVDVAAPGPEVTVEPPAVASDQDRLRGWMTRYASVGGSHAMPEMPQRLVDAVIWHWARRLLGRPSSNARRLLDGAVRSSLERGSSVVCGPRGLSATTLDGRVRLHEVSSLKELSSAS